MLFISLKGKGGCWGIEAGGGGGGVLVNGQVELFNYWIFVFDQLNKNCNSHIKIPLISTQRTMGQLIFLTTISKF